MKKFIVLPLLLIFLLTGCGIFTINPQIETILEQMVARRLAFELAKDNQEIIVPGIAICNVILRAPDKAMIDVYLQDATKKLTNYVASDPLLQADLLMLLGMITIKTPEGPDLNLIILKNAAEGFKTGLLMAERKE